MWLGLEGEVSSTVGDAALYAYLFYAWALLPFFAPLAIYLVEPVRRRRQVMAGLVVLGAFVGVYLLWVVLHNDDQRAHHSATPSTTGASETRGRHDGALRPRDVRDASCCRASAGSCGSVSRTSSRSP